MNRLKQLRLEKKLLQSDIAKIINKSDRAVGQYEREERDPSSETWAILADYFGVSLDYMLGKSDIRNTNKIDLDDIDIAFASGIKGLNKENQEIAKNIIEGLLAKQKSEEKQNLNKNS